MEEEKAAAYYDELIRKGEGAARFKQGLGYSSAASPAENSGRWQSSSSSLLSGFVRSSSKSESEAAKEAELRSIKAKLGAKSGDGDARRGGRRRSRSRSLSPRRRGSGRSRSRSPEHWRSERRKGRSRSPSPRRRMRSERGREGGYSSSRKKEKDEAVDYSRLIDGYDKMTAAERVKAKMKLQLSQTAAKDTAKGKGWERFEFDKDAPLDDEEIEVADDDVKLVRDMGRTFQFSAIEAKREADSEAAHDQAIFGVPVVSPVGRENDCVEDSREEDTADTPNKSNVNLMSEKVLAVQQGSWRDRVRKLQKE